MYKKPLIIFVLLFFNVFEISFADNICNRSQCPQQKQKFGNKIIINCNKDDKCSLKAVNTIGKVFEKNNLYFPAATGIIWHSKSLVQIKMSLGSDDSDSFFFDFNKMILSPTFLDVFAVEENRLAIAYLDDNNQQVISIGSIFKPTSEKIIIKRNFSTSYPQFAVDRQGTNFDRNGNFILDYTEGNNYLERKEIISINYQKLER